MDIDESEMYEGLPPIEGRGIRVRNAHLRLEGVTVDGVTEPVVLEEGAELSSQEAVDQGASFFEA